MNQPTAKRKKICGIKLGTDFYPFDIQGIVVIPKSPKQTQILSSRNSKFGVCNEDEKVKVTNSVQNDNPNWDIQSLNYQDCQIQIDRDASENFYNQNDQSNCNQSDQIHFSPNDFLLPEPYEDQFPFDAFDDIAWLALNDDLFWSFIEPDSGEKRANREKDVEQPDPNCEHLNEQIWTIDENPQHNLKDINQQNQLAENKSLKVNQNNDSLNPIDQNGIFEIQDLNFGSFTFDDSDVDDQF